MTCYNDDHILPHYLDSTLDFMDRMALSIAVETVIMVVRAKPVGNNGRRVEISD